MDVLFAALPIELRFNILRFLDSESLKILCQVSPTFRTFVNANQDKVYRDVAMELGFTSNCCADDTGISILPPAEDPPASPYKCPSLSQTIFCQRTASNIYDEVKTWADFLDVKTRLKRNWNHYLPLTRPCKSYPSPYHSIWRFKVDSEKKFIVGSAHTGNVYVQPIGNEDSVATCYFQPVEHSLFPHIELSDGYLIMTGLHSQFFCYRRSNIPDPSPHIDGNPRNRPYPFAVHRDNASPDNTFDFHAVFDLSTAGRTGHCLKARYPYLAVACASTTTVSLFNIPEKRLEIEFSCETAVDNFRDSGYTYIELDSYYIFVANPYWINVFSIKDKRLVQTIPPHDEHNSDMSDPRNFLHWYNADSKSGWCAIHHDAQGGQLLAAASSGTLFWTSNYHEYLTSKQPWNHCVFLETNSHITNLAVDHEHSAFTLLSDTPDDDGGMWNPRVNSIFTIDLTHFKDRYQFVAPKFNLLTPCHPADEFISRLEIDSAAVYATGTHELVENNDDERIPLAIHKRHAKSILDKYGRDWKDWTWYDADGNELAPAWETNYPLENASQLYNYERSVWSLGYVGNEICNSVLVYSFS